MISDDLTGQRFGRWTVLGRAKDCIYSGGKDRTRWHCRCDCGKRRTVDGTALKTGKSLSCGCMAHDARWDAVDPAWRVFGRLTVMSFAGRHHGNDTGIVGAGVMQQRC